ncbi:MAG TPA: hypothetical protein VN841_28020 [Bryobacteraceae bacterium]|nr:hypothetical protein [Bryobacteraceae bacterium]
MNPTGPRTEPGKMRSRYNAIKHGLTGQTLLIHDDERPRYEAHCASYIELYQPAGHPEQVLVRNIADDYWRSMCGRALETHHLVRASGGAEGEDKILCNLALYIQRIERSIKNNAKALEEMQAKRKEAQRQAEKEVAPPARAAAATGESYNPANGLPPEPGFVFSNPQVAETPSHEDPQDGASRPNRSAQKTQNAA